MRALITSVFLFFSLTLYAQTTNEVVVLEYVEILNGHEEEAMFYYENNWKRLRDIAIRRGVISDYKILVDRSDTSHVQLRLLTEFPGPYAFEKGEERFGQIIEEVGSDGPILLNDITPDQFRKNVKTEVLEGIFQE